MTSYDEALARYIENGRSAGIGQAPEKQLDAAFRRQHSIPTPRPKAPAKQPPATDDLQKAVNTLDDLSKGKVGKPTKRPIKPRPTKLEAHRRRMQAIGRKGRAAFAAAMVRAGKPLREVRRIAQGERLP